MAARETHLSDQELIMAMDGELSAADAAFAQAHIASCWTCRTRKQEIEAAINEFVRAQRSSGVPIPSADGPRALLKARMAQLAESEPASWSRQFFERRKLSWAIFSAACALAAAAYFLPHPWIGPMAEPMATLTKPDPNLTPGAIVLVSQSEVCNGSIANDRPVPVALRRKVFGEYGIKSAEPGAYEVDHLITPALGGSDDIHNLWPQSNRATMWNAHVKDALEEHLRNMVCKGQLDLATAQRDMATNWIDAYKKYFHTDQPLTAYR
jgi:hypothetical protein